MYKKFLIKSIVFILVLVLIDFTIGGIAGYLFYRQSSGKYYRMTYTMENAQSDMLIMGSSHAINHYVPDVFSKALDISCFNTGVQGQKMVFTRALQMILLKRMVPKIILLNIDSEWMYQSNISDERLADLHPYYTKHPKVIRKILSPKSKFAFVKLFSKLYRYNSTLVHILYYSMHKQPDIDGYKPLYRVLLPPEQPYNPPSLIPSTEKLDEYCVACYRDFIQATLKNHCGLYIVTSPNLHLVDYETDRSYQKMLAIARENEIPFLDYSNDTRFLEKYNLFADESHLNHTGAIMFSKMVSQEIKNWDAIHIASLTDSRSGKE